MNTATSRLLQEMFQDTVRRLNELHVETINTTPANAQILHKAWEALNNYQLALTHIIQERSPVRLKCPKCEAPDNYFYITQPLTLRYDVAGELAEDYDCRDLEMACSLSKMAPTGQIECFECGYIGTFSEFNETNPND